MEVNDVGGIVQDYTDDVDLLQWIEVIDEKYERGGNDES
jgi:hypothetical protein